MALYKRRSPVHAAVAGLNPEWEEVQGMRVPKSFGVADAAGRLALCDVSALRKLCVRGRGAAEWLSGQGVTAPEAVYGWGPLAEDGGVIIRTRPDEFFLEDSLEGGTIARLREEAGSGWGGGYVLERQDAGFLLAGEQVGAVMAQTCGADLQAAGGQAVMSLVAGTSCLLLPGEDLRAIRIWCEASYGVYLWEALRGIVCELGGVVAGMDRVREGM